MGATIDFDAQLAALAPSLGLDFSADDRRRLLDYQALIQRWTKVYNLTAVRDAREMFTHHLLDCLAVVAPFRQQLGQGDRQVLDVGSGAGLPGVVLAVLNPTWRVTCVDAVAKKASFIRQVSAELGIANLDARHGRIEAPATLGTQRFDLVTSRAFASLKDFTDLTGTRLEAGGCWGAMKANLTDEERAELPSSVKLFHVEQLSVPLLDATRCIVWMRPAADTATPASPRQ